MADGAEQEDRTEEPTERKLEEAIKRGDVAKSAEINTLFVLGGFTLALLTTSAQVSTSLVFNLRGFLMNAHLVPSDAGGLYAVGRHARWAGLAAVSCRWRSWCSAPSPAARSSTGRYGRSSP